MKFVRRTDPEVWVPEGKCPFYFHPLPPQCAVTRMALGGKDVFEDDEERRRMSELDCMGNMHLCPYVPEMWAIEGPPITNAVPLRSVTIPETGVVLEIDDGDVVGPSDILVIPTTRYGQWLRMGYDYPFSPEQISGIDNDVKCFEMPFDIGTAIHTRGNGTNYRHIIHAVIFDDVAGGQVTVDVVSSAVVSALGIADSIGGESIEIRPICLPLPGGGSLPDVWHVTAIPISMAFSMMDAGRLMSYQKIRIGVLPSGMDEASRMLSSFS